MSTKRPASTQLNYDNRDRDDSEESEEIGTFKTASKEVLEKRVIRTAKRRCQVSSDEPKSSVFGGFGGFNKSQRSSFDFLANLTNGNKSNTDKLTTKTDTAVSSSIFTNKSVSNNPGTIFSMSGSSGFAVKPTFGKSAEGSVFGGTITPMKSVFTATNADSTVNDSLFKLQPSPNATVTDLTSNTNINTDISTSQVSSTIFGVSSNSSPNKSFTSANNKLTLFPTSQPVSSTSTSPTSSTSTTKADSNTTECTLSDEHERRRIRYHSKLKGLNLSVSDWIKKHVEETPLCILSPIFKDYEKYLVQIQDEYEGSNKDIKTSNDNIEKKPSSEHKQTSETRSSETKSPLETKSSSVTIPAPEPELKSTNVLSNNVSRSIFGKFGATNPPNTETPQNNTGGIGTKSSLFSFGINPSGSPAINSGFNFGINSVAPSNPTSVFSVNTTTCNANTPFSFGINKSGLTLNTPAPSNTDTVQESTDEEPPKVEYTPVIEANCVFDIKCKVFIKKDGNFVDKGVGTLYVKKIEETGKHQLLVRANTNLGTVLLNFVLSSSIPIQRMGKNNVMLVCIPTPDAKPPPTPILIRVKTAEEADDVLNKLNEYKA